MKTCNNCSRPVAITPASRVRPMILTHCYLLIGECDCGSTWAVTMHEAAEEDDLLLDGDLFPNHLSDMRESAA